MIYLVRTLALDSGRNVWHGIGASGSRWRYSVCDIVSVAEGAAIYGFEDFPDRVREGIGFFPILCNAVLLRV